MHTYMHVDRTANSSLGVTSRGLKSENKAYKLKRSIVPFWEFLPSHGGKFQKFVKFLKACNSGLTQ